MLLEKPFIRMGSPWSFLLPHRVQVQSAREAKCGILEGAKDGHY